MAGIAGLLFEKQSMRHDLLALAAFGIGAFAFATEWFMLSTGASFTTAVLTCVVPFVIGDVIKSAVIETIVLRLRRTGTEFL